MKLHLRPLLLVAVMLFVPASSFAGVFVSVTIAPPVLPVYAQPVCPGDGYIWTPGYWAYGSYGYYWVPGTWVLAPVIGYLWTPGYWGWGGGFYVWHGGYWGPHVGFYGGVNYGYGYGGYGYRGGRWDHGRFNYNRSVNNINVTNIHNTYNETVVNNVTVNRVSYNGGRGGIAARPDTRQQAVARETHVAATHMQMQHQQAARADRMERASVNHGHPAIAATPRPGAFHDRGVVSARSASAPAHAAAAPARARGQFASSGYAPHGDQQGRAAAQELRNSGSRGQERQSQQQRQMPSSGYASHGYQQGRENRPEMQQQGQTRESQMNEQRMNQPRTPVERAPQRQGDMPQRRMTMPQAERRAPQRPQEQRDERERR
ncbi:MAG: YXWGXW repeat-containing protein [Stenotrophobium sp.]